MRSAYVNVHAYLMTHTHLVVTKPRVNHTCSKATHATHLATLKSSVCFIGIARLCSGHVLVTNKRANRCIAQAVYRCHRYTDTPSSNDTVHTTALTQIGPRDDTRDAFSTRSLPDAATLS